MSITDVRSQQNNLQTQAIKSLATASSQTFDAKHPPALYFFKIAGATDSIKAVIMNFIPDDPNKENGENNIWTGKLVEWNIQSDSSHYQILNKSYVKAFGSRLIDQQSSVPQNSKIKVNDFFSWVYDAIINTMNAIGWFLNIPGDYGNGPQGSWCNFLWGGWCTAINDGSGMGEGVYDSGGPYFDVVYNAYINGYNGSTGGGFEPYGDAWHDPCAVVQPTSGSLKVQDTNSPCNPAVPYILPDPNDPQFDPTVPELLDTTGLYKYPKFKEIVTNLPSFLQQYPNVADALAYYTGFSKTKILRLMQPGAGPKVSVVHNLQNIYGSNLFGRYDSDTKTLEINEDFILNLDATQPQVKIQATALLLVITTLHEFVHYGRDVNHLSNKYLSPNGQLDEAGWIFEMNISPNASVIDNNNAIKWIKFYPYNF